jgi:hypothetical protein
MFSSCRLPLYCLLLILSQSSVARKIERANIILCYGISLICGFGDPKYSFLRVTSGTKTRRSTIQPTQQLRRRISLFSRFSKTFKCTQIIIGMRVRSQYWLGTRSRDDSTTTTRWRLLAVLRQRITAMASVLMKLLIGMQRREPREVRNARLNAATLPLLAIPWHRSRRHLSG